MVGWGTEVDWTVGQVHTEWGISFIPIAMQLPPATIVHSLGTIQSRPPGRQAPDENRIKKELCAIYQLNILK